MRIHTKLTGVQVAKIVQAVPGVHVINITEHFSRSRERGIELALSGSSPYRAQADPQKNAATWDEWGIVIERIFYFDPYATMLKYPTHSSFRRATGNRFDSLTVDAQHKRHDWEYDPARSMSSCECGAIQAEV